MILIIFLNKKHIAFYGKPYYCVDKNLSIFEPISYA